MPYAGYIAEECITLVHCISNKTIIVGADITDSIGFFHIR